VFFDWSAKVPLLIRLPGSSSMRRIPDCASHVDLLPTLIDFCTDGAAIKWVDPIDGRSLRPLMEGRSDQDQATAFVEYMADGVSTPCCMLRRGRYKLIYTHGQQDQLYDMVADPNELHNIASSAAEVLAGLRNELLSWWDPELIRSEVLASQTRRRFIKELPSEMRPPWDYQVHVDDTQRFVRRTSGLALKTRSRWPRQSSIKK
jgi:choline-sulfatase